MAERVWTIVVAAGSGTRFGGPKQLAPLAGRALVARAVDAARSVSGGVVVATAPDLVDAVRAVAGADVVVAGGASRSASVRAGLAAVPEEAGIVVVHDAARPLASPALFAAVVGAVAGGSDGAVPAVAVVDTLRRLDGGAVDRDELVAVQTPQAFRADALRAAHASGADATDDATLVAAAGGRIELVAGERDNLKVTERRDLDLVRALAGPTETGDQVQADDLRVGNGFDVHRFSDDPERPLVLGGVRFAGERGLAGHSDADAVAHACAEAILGGAGLADLGQLFPDTDERWRGADSLVLLREAARLVGEAGWAVANIDCSVIAEHPKLSPHKAEMQANLSDAVGAPVGVAGRRAEGIGGLGRREGIAVLSTALLVRRRDGGSRQGGANARPGDEVAS